MKVDRGQLNVCLAERTRRILVWRLLTPLVLLVPTVKAAVAADQPWANKYTTISDRITDREVQDRLKLSEDQREKITALDATREAELAALPENGRVRYAQMREATKRFDDAVCSVLSAEQQKQWSKLKVLRLATSLGPARDILKGEVHTELKLTDKQTETIDELQKEFCVECERIADDIKDLDGAGTTPIWDRPLLKMTQETALKFDARLGPLLDKTLSPTQRDRWFEIEWQRAATRQGPAVLLDAGVANYLGLSKEQRDAIDSIAKTTEREALKAGKPSEAMRLPAANLEKALDVLTPDQRARWTQMLGKPFRDHWSRFMTGKSVETDGTDKGP